MKQDVYKAQYNRMTQTSVGKLILTLAVPSTVSMLITNVYNLADTYFVSSLGVFESAATGIVFSLMAIIQAIGFMFGTGAGSIISRLLGAGDVEKAKTYSATTFYTGIAAGAVFSVISYFFMDNLMFALGSTRLILPYAKSYAYYILAAVPAMVSSFILNNILRYEGKAFYGMIGLGSGALLNILGDYLLVRHTGMGIAGAGLATCVSQYVSLSILISAFIRRKSQVSIHYRFVSRDPKVIGKTLYTGLPSLVRQGLFGVSASALNHAAKLCGGEMAIAAMSISSRVTNFLFSASIGIGHGFQPVCGFNYGAKKYDRVKQGMLFLLAFLAGLLLILGLLGYFNAARIISAFRDDSAILELGCRALKLQCLVLPLVSASITANMTYQSVGFSVRAAILASFRSGLIFIPVVITASLLFGQDGLIASQPFADILGTVLSIPFIVSMFRHLNRLEKEVLDYSTDTM